MPAPSRNVSSGNSRPVLWALLATALYAVAAAMSKLALEQFNVLQILFLRQLVVLALVLPSLVRAPVPMLSMRQPQLHALRLAGAFLALSCSIWALALLPLTTAIVLGFSRALFVPLLAARFLAEPLTARRIMSLLAGFGGVMIVLRPHMEGFASAAILVPLLGAAGAAIATVSVRRLSQTHDSQTLLTYQALFVGLLAGLPMFGIWKTPDMASLGLLLAIGLVSTAGQWMGIRALRAGDASLVAGLDYLSLVHAAILGLVVFSEIPDPLTLAGAAIIIASATILARTGAPRC
ncbi:MAG TPA: DMT family transporter [Devosia sp.]|nr:DMT family transporter [Devosia sp.]